MNTHSGATLLTVLLLAGLTATRANTPSAAALRARHEREKAPAWADGDQVTFYYRGKADQVTVIFGGDIRQLKRVADSDVWTVATHLPGLQRGVFDYRFMPTGNGQSAPKADSGTWRGPKAPAPAAECATLRGRLKQFEIDSQALGRRRVTVYLPPENDVKKASRVVYATDGEQIARFAHVLEPLITAGRIPPTVLVGVHSGGYLGGPGASLQKYDARKDLRAQEYFPGLNEKRFAEHASFFCTDVPAWAERRFGVSSARQDRGIFGYSNGGRFVVEMGLRHPGIFGQVFAFSVAGNGTFDFGKAKKDLPRFYLTAGTWDKHFHRSTAQLAEQLRQRGVPVHFSSRVAGHDAAVWRDEFAPALVWAWGK